ncbi:MAG: hypothetical protein CME61_01735 [Halobacteriovoraceae bacterium]|nr:hypothetical protein [Halobacteriovoraceae bacterium]|tara:strand:- start:463 stop:933 length:471 start_codon:yes stop_codon:yes gene_type:complete
MNKTHYFYGELSNIDKKDLNKLIMLDNSQMKYPWTLASWEQSYIAENLMCILEHCQNGDIISCVIFSFQSEESLEIHKFIVDKRWRRTGKGRLLFNKLKTEIKTKANLLKCDIVLEVSVENEDAISFYRALGFEPVAKRKSFYSDGSDAYTMILSI